MAVPRGYLDVQLDVARVAARMHGVALAEAALRWTSLYGCLGLGDDFDAQHPVWSAYARDLATGEPPGDVTWRHYGARARLSSATPGPRFDVSAGWFGGEVWDAGRLRLHFATPASPPRVAQRAADGAPTDPGADPARGPAEAPGAGPLSRAQAACRRAELRALFARVRDELPEARSVVGGSWLYDIEAYRRLFPPAYLATAHPSGEGELRYESLWGQFLDHRGRLKLDLATTLRERLIHGGPATTAQLLACLPHPVQRLEAPVPVFLRYFDL